MNNKVNGKKMTMLMGGTMSFSMSLIETIRSGHFTPMGFIMSFIISLAICLIISLFLPVGPISEAASRKCGLKKGSLGARCLESLITDVIFTPLMCISMVTYAYNMSKKHGEHMQFVPAFISSLCVGLVVCFLLAFILTPVFLRIAMKNSDRDEK